MAKKDADKLPDDLKFEDALAKLEEIVAKLENGELALEDSLVQFEKGTALAKFCDDKLKETARKIEVLKKTAAGEAVWAPFEGEAADGDKTPAQ